MICNIHKFREKMDAGQFCLGAGITFYDPSVTEALCDSVDFFWIDLEHNPTSFESVLSHLIAARAGGAPAIVRIPSGDVAWIKRTLDSGAEGIILPQTKSADEIRAFVSNCRYAPMGSRGFGPRRPTNYGRFTGGKYLEHANQNLFVVAQIETVSALNELDAIVAIEGLDSLVVGPYDLSASMGMPGEVHHPKILEAIRQVASKARAVGKYVGMGMGGNAEHALEAAGLGVQWAQCGNDFEYMIRAADQLYQTVRQRLPKSGK
jgi:2-keto-3-deoxy-L-rhamnonate aldolase RhmA